MENLKKIIIEKVTSRINFIGEVTGNIDYTQSEDDCIKDINSLIDKKIFKAQKEISIVLQEKELTTSKQAEYDENHEVYSDYLTLVGLTHLELEERAFAYRLGLSILNHVFIQIDTKDTLEKAIELYDEFKHD